MSEISMSNEQEKSPFTGYFRDGLRRADVILVVKDNIEREDLKTEFLAQAVMLGLELEFEKGVSNRSWLYIKIYAPNIVIENFGMNYQYRRVFADSHAKNLTRSWTELIFPGMKIRHQTVYLSLIRSNYPGPSNYSTLDRSRIVYEILDRISFGHARNYFSLSKMLTKGLIVDAYALHDGPYFLLPEQRGQEITGRQVLFYNWLGIVNICQMQPLHIIAEYLGERVAFFFAFYGLYNFFLLFPAIFGVVIFSYNVIFYKNNVVTRNLCEMRKYRYHDNFCPQCRHYKICPYRNLTDFCNEAKFVQFVDSIPNYVFALFTILCGLIFLISWKRKHKFLMWHWEQDEDYIDYMTRTKYKARSDNLQDPIMLSDQSIFWKCAEGWRSLIWHIIQLSVFIVPAVYGTYQLILVRYKLLDLLFSDKPKYYITRYNAIAIIGLAHALFVVLIEYILTPIVYALLRLESHDIPKYQDSSLTIKLFFPSFILMCPLILYVAFVKGQFTTTPIDMFNWTFLNGILMENCHPLNCMDEVLILYVTTVFVRETFRFLPYLRFYRFSEYNSLFRNVNKNIPIYERERWLQPTTAVERIINTKFQELSLQFASVMMFITVCPLAPLFVLINNAIDLRYTARFILLSCRRPLVRRSAGIGAWRKIFFSILFLSAVTNTLLYVVTSDRVKQLNFGGLEVTSDSYDDHFVNNEIGEFNDFEVLRGWEWKSNASLIIRYPALWMNGTTETYLNWMPLKEFEDIPHAIGGDNKSIDIDHIHMTLFWEYDYLLVRKFPNSPYHEFRKFVPNYLELRHKHSRHNTFNLRRRCYFKGYFKRWRTIEKVENKSIKVPKETYLKVKHVIPYFYGWYLNYHFYTLFIPLEPTNRTFNYFELNYSLKGYTYQWQEILLRCLKLMYSVIISISLIFVLYTIYFMVPTTSSYVNETQCMEHGIRFYSERETKKNR